MCGIFGGNTPLLMNNPEKLLRHRGPDQHGKVTFKIPDQTPFIFGMTRLNIVDRHDIPVPFKAKNAYIAFNGEIYNWREIRHELEKKGVAFVTHTDVEVVIHAYLKWGPACLNRFNGMFALAIWNKGELFLARDRLGKKPLFYYHDKKEGCAFGSEIKVFKDLEYEEIDVCEKLEFYFNEHTPFKNIKSLKPGEYLLYDSKSKKAHTHTWWTYPKYQGTITDKETALAEFLPLFENACSIRKVADVPVTLFLSGGIDSSLIQAMLGFKQTYTVQFSEFAKTIDEENLVKEFAELRKFKSIIIRPSQKEFEEMLPDLARHIEFPVGSFSVFPLYCLAKAARKDGFKVALSGEGADEFFNGYFRNEMLLAEDATITHYHQGAYSHLTTHYFGSRVERECRMASRGGAQDIPLLKNLFAAYWNEQAPFSHNLSAIESTFFLQPLLIMADRMSMANSLEVRNPFMDHRIVEFSTKLTPELRFNQRGKYILFEALKKVLGTDDLGILKRKEKHGLPSPVNTWFFKKNNFDRKDWNRILLGECLSQMALR